ncbi:putative secreted protein (Por secretion system target) [Ulvibacter sp. MAR_2010_11]|uniref:T9SS type A sorting domain-containing protein n=1 Tax=Ulvibacter sp. MAR_2010_11 TaxID=1250229 RepID=UPI000C2BD195|nr:T9SS type A sorting domain-containing protein [Ulvibacter sp. MAR_2010_11]PKA83462.1 putative secreted protein (Por secretion system target) [Ulvibacter sp. MAR_2010_11]
MKKNYFLAALFSFAMIGANAQFAMDDMESYGGGNTPILQDHWGSWDGTAGTAMFSSNAHAQSGSLSGYVDGSTTMDPLLLLGDKIFGSWGVKFSMYIPSGKVGYWNLQGQETPGIQWVVGNIYFGNSGIGGDTETDGRIDMSTGDETDDFTFTFPKDQWFTVIMNFDFNAGAGASTWTLWVDNAEVVAPGTPFADGTGVYAQALGAINLYSLSTDNEMYVDDVEYINDFYPDPNLGIGDLNAKGFAAYPNPVSNVLNLRANEEISSVAIFNVLGQQVYNAKVNALNSTIDMSSYASGAYFVKVNVSGTEGIVKIVK